MIDFGRGLYGKLANLFTLDYNASQIAYISSYINNSLILSLM